MNSSTPHFHALNDARGSALQTWLAQQQAAFQLNLSSLAIASADASFRRYFRIHTLTNTSLIVMDAPPPQEDCHPFVRIAKLFADAGLHVPKVLAHDLQQGFLLLTDLGNTTYLSELGTCAQPAQGEIAHVSTRPHQIYRDAIDALITLQRAPGVDQLPEYDRALLQRELDLFPDWYLTRHCAISLNAQQQQVLSSTSQILLDQILTQPRVMVHRDYHCRNLMVTAERNPGVLDFQDAVAGPLTYDLVSLLRDAYIEWEEPQVIDWCVYYWKSARAHKLAVTDDFGTFYRDFEWMGLQRHIKVLGIFARLYHRDGKSGYVKDMPLVMRYTQRVAQRYREFFPLARLLDSLEPQASQLHVGYTF